MKTEITKCPRCQNEDLFNENGLLAHYCPICGLKLTNNLKSYEEIEDKESAHRCCLCGESANLKMDGGRYICDTCAQIQGELADD